MLGPVANELPQLSQYYQSMALALDTTRHELQTHGVNIPVAAQDQQQFEGESHQSIVTNGIASIAYGQLRLMGT